MSVIICQIAFIQYYEMAIFEWQDTHANGLDIVCLVPNTHNSRVNWITLAGLGYCTTINLDKSGLCCVSKHALIIPATITSQHWNCLSCHSNYILSSISGPIINQISYFFVCWFFFIKWEKISYFKCKLGMAFQQSTEFGVFF